MKIKMMKSGSKVKFNFGTMIYKKDKINTVGFVETNNVINEETLISMIGSKEYTNIEEAQKDIDRIELKTSNGF